MNPDQIALVSSVISIVEKIWSWPAGLLFVGILVGPWLLTLWLHEGERRRFDGVVKMYENNVALAKELNRINGEQKDIIILNTQNWMAVREAIEKNQFCPMVRLEKKIMKPGGPV